MFSSRALLAPAAVDARSLSLRTSTSRPSPAPATLPVALLLEKTSEPSAADWAAQWAGTWQLPGSAQRAQHLEMEHSAKLQVAARECARLQHQVKAVGLACHSMEDVSRLQGMVEHLEEAETELVVHQLLLQSIHEHPEGVNCEHDPALQHQAQQVVRNRKAQGLAAMLEPEAAAGVDSESLAETETQALMTNLELEIQYLESQYIELRAQVSAMQADPVYRFNPNDPLAACHWQRLLHAHTHVVELEEAILVRQLLLRNIKKNPDGCSHSVHDPALEHEARTLMKQRKLLEKQLGEVVTSMSSQIQNAPHLPAAMLLLMLVALSAA